MDLKRTHAEQRATVLEKVSELLDIPDVEVEMQAGSREKVQPHPTPYVEMEYDGSMTLTIRVPPGSMKFGEGL